MSLIQDWWGGYWPRFKRQDLFLLSQDNCAPWVHSWTAMVKLDGEERVTNNTLFRIGLRNDGLERIEQVVVQAVKLDPHPVSVDYLPVSLYPMHFDVRAIYRQMGEFYLLPGEGKFVDVVQHVSVPSAPGFNAVMLWHTLAHRPVEIQPAESMKISIEVFWSGGLKIEATYSLDINRRSYPDNTATFARVR